MTFIVLLALLTVAGNAFGQAADSQLIQATRMGDAGAVADERHERPVRRERG